MERIFAATNKLSHEFDRIAGFFIVGVMVLVVSNILLRNIFKNPILGTYELVGYLTALAVSFSLAQCAVKNGHIALDYLINKFPKKVRMSAGMLVTTLSFAFWSLATWHFTGYGLRLLSSGEVTPTAQLPVYPFVFLISLGFAGLCFVSFSQALERSKIFLSGIVIAKPASRPVPVEYARKAVR